jgi:hypothetical protein
MLSAWGFAGLPGVSSPGAQIGVAAAFCVALALAGVRRVRAETGSIDLFHPLGFPLLYVGFSFLAPLWLDDVAGTPLRGLRGSTPIASDTVALMIIGVAGFAAGSVVRFRPRQPSAPRRAIAPVSPSRLLAVGRLLLLLPLTISLERVIAGAVRHRGLNQLVVSPHSVLSALLDPTEIAAVVLILVAHRMARHDRLMHRLDWLLVGGLILLIGARGSRGNAIALMLVLTLGAAYRRGRIRAVLLGVGVMAVFGVVVLQYRSTQAGHEASRGAVDTLVGDMTVASFSTGATAWVVPSQVPYAHGSTYVAALERQLPSPLVTPVLGAPDDTAARRFRQLIGFTNPDAGIGYSIPAEGYLNFGRLGVFGVMLGLGLVLAAAYARFDPLAERTTRLLYPVTVAVLPFGLRSDSLGLTKTILYSAILIQLALVLARTAELRERPSKRLGQEARSLT